MPQFYQVAFNEAISFDPKTGHGGARNLFAYSHFKKLPSNKPLGVNNCKN